MVAISVKRGWMGMSSLCMPVMPPQGLTLFSHSSTTEANSVLNMCSNKQRQLVSHLLSRQRQHEQEIKKTTLTYDDLTQTGCIPIKTKATGLHVIYSRCYCLFSAISHLTETVMFQSLEPFHPDESTGELPVFFVISLLLSFRVYIYSYSTCSLFSVFSLSQALASHRAYLLTARIPTKVRTQPLGF